MWSRWAAAGERPSSSDRPPVGDPRPLNLTPSSMEIHTRRVTTRMRSSSLLGGGSGVSEGTAAPGTAQPGPHQERRPPPPGVHPLSLLVSCILYGATRSLPPICKPKFHVLQKVLPKKAHSADSRKTNPGNNLCRGRSPPSREAAGSPFINVSLEIKKTG